MEGARAHVIKSPIFERVRDEQAHQIECVLLTGEAHMARANIDVDDNYYGRNRKQYGKVLSFELVRQPKQKIRVILCNALMNNIFGKIQKR